MKLFLKVLAAVAVIAAVAAAAYCFRDKLKAMLGIGRSKVWYADRPIDEDEVAEAVGDVSSADFAE